MTERPPRIGEDQPGPRASGTGRYRFTLFVAGSTRRSRIAYERLLTALEGLDGPYDLEVVDVLEDPATAERARVMATPMVVREFPPPHARALGDLSDMVRLLASLDLPTNDETGSAR